MNLVVSGLCKKFGDRQVLSGVDLQAGPGSAIAIVGPSGSGKSTLLNIVGSLISPDSGEVSLGEIRVDGLRGKQLEEYRSKVVGFVFQEHLLLPHLTALENVLLPSLGSGAKAPVEPAKRLLARTGLGDRMSDFPATLSLGQRQRVALARALVYEPNLVLADEPTGSLDSVLAREQVELLLYEAHDNGRIVLMVTHNRDLAELFDRIYRLEFGSLVAEAK